MAENEYQFESMKEIRVGKYILIDGIPCKVVEIDTSSPGKHGAAKMRVTAIGIFDDNKKTIIKPSSADIEVPIITKRKAQVVSVNGNNVQLMDSETFEVYELPLKEEFKDKISQGKEIEIIEAMGKKAIAKV
ncbi:MAG: translation initiation factor IF-5A [Candidatus Marsarchaeota archaeon]|jgi:translation initiation factor 5A|nr:translation initiation factor IF-5A [Candidatus Marsarchaeota archaeon]